jgi:hypothetical protein
MWAPHPENEHTHGWYFGGDTKCDPWSAPGGLLTAFDASELRAPIIVLCTRTDGQRVACKIKVTTISQSAVVIVSCGVGICGAS